MIEAIISAYNFYKLQMEYKKIKFTKEEKIKLSTYNKDFEKQINSKLNEKLCVMLLDNNLTPEFIRGYKMANQIRLALFNKTN